MKQGSFGRRPTPQRQARREREVAQPVAQNTQVEIADTEQPSPQIHEPSFDHELHEWKQARKKNFRIPWRQLSLMASLCFGIASFVLPDSLNGSVQWLLYALAGMSLYAGFSKRRAKSQ